ncbi:lipopolysaccharide assembly protein LapB [Methylococcus sp. EFPC2]|uniref:lipopolysaccharide assembly protein LapB n=1 Tax=Methylococcus sp. EFPC2 TaxID=2812648 RepID=UPI001967EAB5|nr:lipopolysaccharide assembly protein LapB [Methylococcus sp. EFPC2]QSA95545.1 lipopolysaccharide assembly protein LapB [Methylococcus sp. EFPC2]
MPEGWALLILLPVAAASGWYAAQRHYSRKYLVEHTHNLRQAYCRGLNYLLRERTDKAIEAFADLLVNDCETHETHIALGNLYRRRGELERAIEIHEALISRDGLSPEQRASAQFELGLDYARAGLLDRAEAILSNLTDHPAYGKLALQQLLQVYEHEKDWRKAMECTRKLAAIGKVPRGAAVAQFLCELAEEELAASRHEEARSLLEAALDDDPRCVRATLLLARLHMRDGGFEEALSVLKRVESQNPAYVPEILEPVRICHARLDRPVGELLGYLGYLYETYGYESAALELARQLRGERGVQRASEHLLRVVDAHPSLKALNTLSGLLLEDAGESQREALIRLDRALDRMAVGQAKYHCTHCGFSGTDLHWCCPSCRHWESTRPL